MHLTLVFAKRFDAQKFADIAHSYQCPRAVAEGIAQDLVTNGQRSTTVQYHLLQQWKAPEKDLRAVGVAVESTLPSLTPAAPSATHIKDRVEALRQQFALPAMALKL